MRIIDSVAEADLVNKLGGSCLHVAEVAVADVCGTSAGCLPPFVDTGVSDKPSFAPTNVEKLLQCTNKHLNELFAVEAQKRGLH